MKKIKYICDLCHQDIIPHNSLKSKDKCVYHIIMQDRTVDPIQVMYERRIDICDKCQSALTAHLHTMSTNEAKPRVEDYIPTENLLKNQMDLFDDPNFTL